MTWHFLNDFANDAESTQNRKKYMYAIIAGLKSETMGKLINRIPGSSLDIKFTRLGFENAY